MLQKNYYKNSVIQKITPGVAYTTDECTLGVAYTPWVSAPWVSPIHHG